MDSMGRDLACDPGLEALVAARAGPRTRGQKCSGSGRLGHRHARVKSAAAACAALAWLALPATSGAAAETASGAGLLRVGTSGDYPPFSDGTGPDARGFDLELARAFAKDQGLRVELVAFRWPRLEAELAAGRFDVAFSGVTVRPERSVAGRFALPVAEAGAIALVADPARHATLDALDDAGVRIGVNAGGHLERAARRRFPRATVIAIPSNAAVADALAEGLVDAVVSDTAEAPRWLARAPGAEALAPFTRDRKAPLVRAERPELAAALDAWLLAREADGTLARLRTEHLGRAEPRTATPLAALAAAIDERLSLMPAVADAKRRAGLPLAAPAREREVIEAGVAAAERAAQAAGAAPPAEAPLRALFAALVESAKEVQQAALRLPAPEAALDLDAELRPAISRIGEKIAFLALRLPPEVGAADALAALREGVRTPGASEASLRALSGAIASLSAQPRMRRSRPPRRRPLRGLAQRRADSSRTSSARRSIR
jgi:cyclohexadienyl dehydratase